MARVRVGVLRVLVGGEGCPGPCGSGIEGQYRIIIIIIVIHMIYRLCISLSLSLSFHFLLILKREEKSIIIHGCQFVYKTFFKNFDCRRLKRWRKQ